MDELDVPPVVTVDPSASLNTLLADRVATLGEATFIERKTSADGPWEPITAREFDASVVAVDKGLVAR